MTHNREQNVYKTVLSLSIPIVIQNIFSTAVSSADVMMIGTINQTALSAVSLASQIQFVLSLIYIGLTLGTSVLVAQYFGKKDQITIEKIQMLGIKIVLVISFIFSITSLLFPSQIMHLFTTDLDIVEYGIPYLKIVGLSYLFTGTSQILQSVMKATEKVKQSSFIATSTLLINITLNALFIFGWFSFPQLGVLGVALGTFISRLIELLLCLTLSSIPLRLHYFLKWDSSLFKDFVKYALPITLNGLSWGSAFATYSIIMGHLGSDVVAANSIATIARNFAMVGCSGFATGGGIYLGIKLGQGDLDTAKTDAPKIIKITFLMSILGGVLILVLSPILSSVSNLSDQANEYLKIMLIINAYYVMGKALNSVTNNGIFCAGGDTKFGLICDTVDMWGVFVPLGFICAFILKLPPMVVYFILCLDEFAKLPFVYRHYKKYQWLRNITTDQK